MFYEFIPLQYKKQLATLKLTIKLVFSKVRNYETIVSCTNRIFLSFLEILSLSKCQSHHVESVAHNSHGLIKLCPSSACHVLARVNFDEGRNFSTQRKLSNAD